MITLKLVELDNNKFAVLRKDGFGAEWKFSEINSIEIPKTSYRDTWRIAEHNFKYCCVDTIEDGEAALTNVYEALMNQNRKIKILRTIRVLKVKK